MEQVDILSIFGQTTKHPYFFSLLSNGVQDTKTLINTINDLKAIDIEKMIFVLDTNYFSAPNLKYFYDLNIDYLIKVNTNTSYIKNALDENIEELKSPLNYVNTGNEIVNGIIIPIDNHDISGKTNYLYSNYNDDIALTLRKSFDEKIRKLHIELETGEKIEDNENLYQKYFYKDG